MEEKSAFDSFELEVNEEIKGFLKETSSWTYFLSIIGFIGLGFMVLGGVVMSFAGNFNKFPGDIAYGVGYSVGVGLAYVFFALIYFFPILYLFKFSKNIKKALSLNNNDNLKMAFSSLKSHYKYMGIFVIVIISLYILIIIGALAGASFL
ncbi:DUF5362 family protein [Flaviramulus sp. BrNp1-15]|uniref:DUF5362 family protein n=1 Tax=Flaviramulus sp. BrNp1-15 TaxID=2916754 RepID=UPI001EE8FC9F|nr:DUF5362 family protein [Flaviramulus sp. BrNp1-15]ULC60840.1 DUF5362 family protein [Flaviramulus sp. BrNp1-15]